MGSGAFLYKGGDRRGDAVFELIRRALRVRFKRGRGRGTDHYTLDGVGGIPTFINKRSNPIFFSSRLDPNRGQYLGIPP